MSGRRGLTSTWQKSSLSETTGCVEVRLDSGMVHVRNSRDPGGPQLAFTDIEWTAFLGGARLGEFEIPAAGALAPSDHAQ